MLNLFTDTLGKGSLAHHAITESREPHVETELLHTALDQVGFGLVAVDADTGAVQFSNILGRAALEDALDTSSSVSRRAALRLLNGCVVAGGVTHNNTLRTALQRTKSGIRGLLSVGTGDSFTSVAVLPLLTAPGTEAQMCTQDENGRRYALLVFARRQLCDDSAIALFSSGCGLTNAESQVLVQVCKGKQPADIACQNNVQISTVRTQLRSIRIKTGCLTLRQLVATVSLLPPMAQQRAAVTKH